MLFTAGFALGVFMRQITLGVLLFAAGAILFAVRGYLNTGDKAVAGALIFVALAAIGIQLIVVFLAHSGTIPEKSYAKSLRKTPV